MLEELATLQSGDFMLKLSLSNKADAQVPCIPCNMDLVIS